MSAFKVIRTLARASVLETVRRRDIYVVLILSVLMMLAGSTFRVLGVRDLETILKDVTLVVVNLMSTILCVMVSVRQLPEEIQRRTLYPLLARPIPRWQLVAGKFVGAAFMSEVTLLALTSIACLNLALVHVPLGPILWEYLALRIFCQLLVCAMSLALSLMLTPSAALTVSFLLVVAASSFSSAILLLPESVSPVAGTALKAVYFVCPHVDLFDLHSKVAHDWPLIPGWVIGFLGLYSLVYVALFLGVGIYRFQKQAL